MRFYRSFEWANRHNASRYWEYEYRTTQIRINNVPQVVVDELQMGVISVFLNTTLFETNCTYG